MPQSRDGFYIFGSKADPHRDADRVIKQVKPKISESVLSVTLGERLRRRAGEMPNIRGDRPEPTYGDDG